MHWSGTYIHDKYETKPKVKELYVNVRLINANFQYSQPKIPSFVFNFLTITFKHIIHCDCRTKAWLDAIAYLKVDGLVEAVIASKNRAKAVRKRWPERYDEKKKKWRLQAADSDNSLPFSHPTAAQLHLKIFVQLSHFMKDVWIAHLKLSWNLAYGNLSGQTTARPILLRQQ
jgi:hypothetical protein